MFVRGRRLALASVFAAIALVGSGCGSGGSKPVSLPSLSSSTTASPTPSPTSTAGAADAATAIVRRYFSLLNAPTSVETGNAVGALMTAKCSCRRVSTSIVEVARKHQAYFGRNNVLAITAAADGPTVVEALVEYDYTRGGIKDSTGRVVTRTPGAVGTQLNFILDWRQGHWLIAEVQLIDKGRPT